MPEATVAAIITNTQDDVIRVLLTRRNVQPFRGQWCLPGGHIDQYETARDAIIREVKEETGLELEAQYFGYFDEIIPELRLHAIVTVFEGQGSGMLQAQLSEVSEIGWFSLDEARTLPLAFTHNEILDAYAAYYGAENNVG